MIRLQFVLLISLIAIACSSRTSTGNACSTQGSTDECVDGDVCGQSVTGQAVCQKICTDQAQCASTENCNGTSGSLKGCRAK